LRRAGGRSEEGAESGKEKDKAGFHAGKARAVREGRRRAVL
jgi:hypothetical protein